MEPRFDRVQPRQGSKPVVERKPIPRRRKATVFDAVAGRVGYESFLHQEVAQKSQSRDTATTSTLATPADEVLFRRKGAPTRYAENDIYFADSRLDSVADTDQKLPDSDLVKYLHAYASTFYHNATANKGKHDWRSMDETALLAMAVLLEETAKQKLGSNGDLAFIEDQKNDLLTGRKKYWNGDHWVQSVVTKRSAADRVRRKTLKPASNSTSTKSK